MSNAIQLPAHCFTWEKYCSKKAYAVTQLLRWNTTPQGSREKLQIGVKLIGYCNAKDLSIRPRTLGFAVMLEIDGDEVWCHAMEIPE